MIRKIIQQYKSAFSGLSKETWLLSIVILINRCGTMAVPFMSIYITQSLHRSIADAGLIITLFGVGAVAGSMAGGYFTDKIGFRPVQIFTTVASGLLFILFGQLTDFKLLCVLITALGFVVEAFRPANLTAIATYSSPENLTRSYALNRLAINIGWGLGSSFGGILAAVNYHLLFWVESTVCITVGLLIFILMPSIRHIKQNREISVPAAKALSPWKDIFFIQFFVLLTIYTTCFILLFKLVPVFWKEQWHIDESVIGILMGLNGLIIALFEMVLVKHWDGRRPRMYYVITGVILTAGGYTLLVIPGMASIPVAIGVVVLITMGEMRAVSFMNTVVMKRANEHNKGKYLAAYALSWSIALIAGPGGGAIIADKWGYPVLWIILVVLCLFCSIAFKMITAKAGLMQVA